MDKTEPAFLMKFEDQSPQGYWRGNVRVSNPPQKNIGVRKFIKRPFDLEIKSERTGDEVALM